MSDKEDLFTESHLLRRAILDLSRRKVQLIDHAILPLPIRKSAPSESSAPIDVVITPNEITPLHGTGVLISRIFGEKEQIFSLRSRNDYGEHSFGTVNVCLTHSGLSRSEAYSNVVQSLSGRTPQRALCVPFFSDDALSALAVRQTYGVPLCTYIMDDNNVASRGISDDLMTELLENSTLRLAISSELREAYEEKYHLKFWLLPPVVDPKAIAATANDPKREFRDAKRGILIGNIWSRTWLSALRATMRNSGLRVDWYGKLQEWLKVSVEELSEDGIDARGFIAESELASLCRSYPYALIPSGTLDHREDHPAVARFSLPSRMPFILAACNTPMIVLGSSATAAARFVERLEVGIAASYDARAFQEAVEIVSSRQQEFRERAVKLAERFSARNVASWIWKSLALGQACDSRFEGVMPRMESDRVSFLESPAPKGIRRDLVPAYQAMSRLKNGGLNPDFVIDVGSSTGAWSDAVQRIFENARFVLADPLNSKYVQPAEAPKTSGHARFERVEAAVSNRAGKAEFQVSPELRGSSLSRRPDCLPHDSLEVRVVTIDQLAIEKGISGRGILRINASGAEHLVLEGAADFLSQIDVVVIWVSLTDCGAAARSFSGILVLMENLGFRYFDDAGNWRSPVDGTLLRKEAVFLRSGLLALPPAA
ncbi:MAG TPA: FkbM family methyltransferase [Terrimicrobiaceae bacterium]|nr:FkbM family methyltransferase [Terrimicrobiaceae bacterium]